MNSNATSSHPQQNVLPTFWLGLKPLQGTGHVSFMGSVCLLVPISPEHLSSVSQKDGASGRIFTLSHLNGKTEDDPWSYLAASVSLFYLSRKNDDKLTWRRVFSAQRLLEKDAAYPSGHSFPCAQWGLSHPFSLCSRHHGIYCPGLRRAVHISLTFPAPLPTQQAESCFPHW